MKSPRSKRVARRRRAPPLVLIGCIALITAPARVVCYPLFAENFSAADPATGLPPGWTAGPPAHAPFFSTHPDTDAFGAEPPSLRVDLPLNTLNYHIFSPRIALPALDADYTLEVGLRVQQPGFPFQVRAIVYDVAGRWLGLLDLQDLHSEDMDSLRTFRATFRPAAVSTTGQLRIAIGLPYTKTLRQGRAWIDDVVLHGDRRAAPLDLYLRPWNVAGGEDVEICVSSGADRVALELYHELDRSVPLVGPIFVTGLVEQPVPDEAWRTGCHWPASTTISTGEDWPSGRYRVTADNGDTRKSAYFVVRARGGEGPVLVVLPTHTEQAYNTWGGRSLYTSPPAAELSFDRPVSVGRNMVFYQAAAQLIPWLSREGVGFGVATDDDLHERPDLIYSYPGIIIPGHSEYWTASMREAVEGYIDSGGSVLSLGGNTCWWQTRSEGRAEGRRLVCYKYAADDDPYWTIDPKLVTTRWDEPPVSRPPEAFLGLSWRYGGQVNWSTSSDCPCPYDWLDGHGGYTVESPDHWVFEGTALQRGDLLGQEPAIVGYEVDGTRLQWIEGRPAVHLESGTPPVFEVLGHAPCWHVLGGDDAVGNAVMGIMELEKGFVFNAGTTGWCWGLAGDSLVQRVTRNLIERLGDAPHRRRSTEPLTAYPTPCSGVVTLEIGGIHRPRWVEVFTVGGRRVARLAVSWRSPLRSEAAWEFRDSSGRRLPSGVYWVRAGHRAVRVVHLR